MYNILYIEDYEPAAITMDFVFKDLGHSAFHAANGADALKMYNENTYDIVFIDINLPDMNGYEIAERLRSHELYDSKTVIIGHSADIAIIDNEKGKIFDFITDKDFDPSAIKKKLKEWMASNSGLKQSRR